MTNPFDTVPGNGRNGTSTAHPTLWITQDWEYALVTRIDWHPIIAQRPRYGTDKDWVTHDLTATQINLVNVADSHHAVAMAVDAEGIIHVSGNTHDDATGLRYIMSDQPHDISSWSAGPRPPGWETIGWDRTCYASYDCFSDGTLIWSMSQNDSTAWPTGRDWTLWRKPPESGWESCLASGGEIMKAENHPTYEGAEWRPPGTNLSELDAIPDRSYVLNTFIDSDDVYHLFGVWRMSALQRDHREAFYVRSLDQCSTWENVYGESVQAPFEYPTTLDGGPGTAPARIVVDGYPVYMLEKGGTAVDSAGNVHATFDGKGNRHLWHDGDEWRMEPLVGYSWADPPTLSFTRSTLARSARPTGHRCGA